MGISGECLPHDGNVMELSDELDGRGLPKPRIHFTAGENEHRLMEHARRQLHAIRDAAGAADTWTFDHMATRLVPVAWAPTPKPPSWTPTGALTISRTSISATTLFSHRTPGESGSDHHGLESPLRR